MSIAKTRIDKAGTALSRNVYRTEEEYLELEHVFDEYRKSHLQPLTESTLELQDWLAVSDVHYYIAQRLKRKPQIIRKLNRLSVRLTQLQDIGGCRIIVETDTEVDKLNRFIQNRVEQHTHLRLHHISDYREKGRDDTGYRALHLILERDACKLELQIRSKVQHYWAESIERTSVIYGYHLKEKEGDAFVISYFKKLSDIFYEIEAGREPSAAQKISVDRLRQRSEEIIKQSDKNRVLDSYVNDNIIKTLTSIEENKRDKSNFNNWIITFDWNTGSFVSWDRIGRDPDSAIRSYVEHENSFSAQDGFEVVMIGSSDIATVRQTHSHYFGVEGYDNILEKLDQSVIGFSRRMDIDTDARQILHRLYSRHFWGKKGVGKATLKNHYCQHLLTFESSLQLLIDKGLVIMPSAQSSVSLNPRKKGDIARYLGR